MELLDLVVERLEVSLGFGVRSAGAGAGQDDDQCHQKGRGREDQGQHGGDGDKRVHVRKEKRRHQRKRDGKHGRAPVRESMHTGYRRGASVSRGAVVELGRVGDAVTEVTEPRRVFSILGTLGPSPWAP